jgi:hypothetical protein
MKLFEKGEMKDRIKGRKYESWKTMRKVEHKINGKKNGER